MKANAAPVIRCPVEIDFDTRYRKRIALHFGKGMFVRTDLDLTEVTRQRSVWQKARNTDIRRTYNALLPAPLEQVFTGEH